MFLLWNRLCATFVVDGNHGSCGDNLNGDDAVNSVVESAVTACVKTAGKLRDDRTSFLHRFCIVFYESKTTFCRHAVFTQFSRSFHASFHGTFHDTFR